MWGKERKFLLMMWMMFLQRGIGSMRSNPRVIKSDLLMFLSGICFFDDLWKFPEFLDLLDFLLSFLWCFIIKRTCFGLPPSGGLWFIYTRSLYDYVLLWPSHVCLWRCISLVRIDLVTLIFIWLRHMWVNAHFRVHKLRLSMLKLGDVCFSLEFSKYISFKHLEFH